jgi:hypothetical protein
LLTVAEVLVATTCHATLVTLIRQPSSHHVGRLVRGTLNHMMLDVASNGGHIFLDDGDATGACEMAAFANVLVVVLLCLDDVATEHLRIFYFDLRIVENIIIVVYVLYYFNWLVLLFLRFGRGASPCSVRTVDLIADRFRLPEVLLVRICKILLETRQITPLDLAISCH